MIRCLALASFVLLGVVGWACGPAPRPAPPLAAPWDELAALPARAEIAVAVADASAAMTRLTEASDLGGDELAAWLAPRFAGRTWSLDRLGDAGLDAGGPVAAARLDGEADTVVRSARVVDHAALERAVEEALRASGTAPARSVVGGVEIVSAGADALIVRGERALFVTSGAVSQRDRAAVEVAAGDGPVLQGELAPLIAAIGAGDIAVATRGAATSQLVATETPTGAAAATLTRTGDGLVSRLAVAPPPSAPQVELGLAVDLEARRDAPVPAWPERPRDENPDVPLSPEYQRIAAELDALDTTRRALESAIASAIFEQVETVNRRFRARAAWTRTGAIAVADLRIALPGNVVGAVRRAREIAHPMVLRRELAVQQLRDARAAYAQRVAELVRIRARDVAAHDRAPR